MARSKVYHTKQKDIIFNVICNYKHKFTVKDLYHALNDGNLSVLDNQMLNKPL